MVIYSLTNRVYTNWGAKYSSFNWRPEWYTFIRIYNREIKELEFHEYFATIIVGHIISWFDNLILQRIGIDSEFTLRVRIRILCGLINKISHNKLTRDMKIEFMECIWDIYNKFHEDWKEYHCKYILQLPF